MNYSLEADQVRSFARDDFRNGLGSGRKIGRGYDRPECGDLGWKLQRAVETCEGGLDIAINVEVPGYHRDRGCVFVNGLGSHPYRRQEAKQRAGEEEVEIS
ncbi:uncharacterized protein METZ01_LOCUS303286 [marine metagenome]|uniref:Uncharacterized protein n=1 Tax=marine metagenome TaxID=408172 RepID=A0A382MSK0_9ZZZZ